MSDKKDRLNELRIDRADPSSTGTSPGLALGVIALLLVVGGGAFWWFRAQGQVPEVRVASVETLNTNPAAESVLDATGYVTARRRATVSSKVTGKIVEVLIEEGMSVREGQVLARLDNSTASRLLALAEAELGAATSALAENEVRLAEAELNLDRARRLVESNVASQSDLDSAQAEVDSIKARLDVGREQIAVAERTIEVRRQELEDTIIRSPFDGIVVTKNAQPGEMISPVSAGGGFTRTGIGTVVDMESLEIEVDVNEAYINRVASGQKVSATLDAYPDWKIPATVITPVPTADRQKATVRVRIGFDGLDPRILPDMGIKVSFLDASPPPAPVEDTGPLWRVSSRAVRQDGDVSFVFVYNGGTLERRAINVVEERDGQTILNAGVQAGEQVVVEGPEDLVDGAPVKLSE